MSWPEWVIVAIAAWTLISFVFAFSLGRIIRAGESMPIRYRERQDEAA